MGNLLHRLKNNLKEFAESKFLEHGVFYSVEDAGNIKRLMDQIVGDVKSLGQKTNLPEWLKGVVRDMIAIEPTLKSMSENKGGAISAVTPLMQQAIDEIEKNLPSFDLVPGHA